jgi:hypothetical protein
MTALLATLAVAFGPSIPPAALDHTHEHHHLRELDARVPIVRPYKAKLTRMAWCESTGRWQISTGNGYYGGLQFDLQTWQSVGGAGYPHWHSRLEQMYRAVLLIHRRGYQPWPVCGYA